jgi:hypothetical protein
MENIARQNKHQLIFLLRHEDKAQLAVYYGKLYKNEWKPFDDLQLAAKGFTLDDVWNGFLEQIALQINISIHGSNDDIGTRLQKQDEILKLQKEIDRQERLTRCEKQPKKKFELYIKLQNDLNKLERGGDT